MSTCKGCGKTIVLIEAPGKDGKKTVRVPLDLKAPVYRVDSPGEGTRAEDRYMVSHLATCRPEERK